MNNLKTIIQKFNSWQKALSEKDMFVFILLKYTCQYFVTYLLFALTFIMIRFCNLIYNNEFDNILDDFIIIPLMFLPPLLYLLIFSRNKLSIHTYLAPIILLFLMIVSTNAGFYVLIINICISFFCTNIVLLCQYLIILFIKKFVKSISYKYSIPNIPMNDLKTIIQKSDDLYKALSERNFIYKICLIVIKIVSQYLVTYFLFALIMIIIEIFNVLCDNKLDDFLEYIYIIPLMFLPPLLYLLMFSRNKFSIHTYLEPMLLYYLITIPYNTGFPLSRIFLSFFCTSFVLICQYLLILFVKKFI